MADHPVAAGLASFGAVTPDRAGLEQVLAAVRDAVCIITPDGRVCFLNEAATRITGWDNATASGQPYRRVLDCSRLDGTSDPGEFTAVDRALRDGGTHTAGPCLLWSRSGDSTPVACTCTPLPPRGDTPQGVVVTCTDVGERLDARRYRSLMDAESRFVWRADAQGAWTDVSAAWSRITGQPQAEALGQGWLKAIWPEDRAGFQTAWARAIETGERFVHRYRVRAVDGTPHWFSVHGARIRDNAGETLEWFGATEDVTEEQRAREELEREREQYRTLVESTSAILWRGDPATFHFTYVSPNAETLLGYPVERWTDEPDFWVSHIHPDDRAWAPAFCARATGECRQHTFDYRMIASDGRTVWLRDVVSVLLREGKPETLVGVMVDITETREAAQAIAYLSGLQQILVEQAEALTGAGTELDDVVTQSLARIGEYCEVDRTYLIRLEGDQQAVTMTHEWHAASIDPLLGDLVARPREASPQLFRCIEKGERVQVDRVADLGEAWQVDVRTFDAQGGVKSFALVPMRFDDVVHGYVGLDVLREERPWDAEEIRLLQGLADVIAAAMLRRRAEQARAESDARFRSIADHMPGAVFERVLEPDGAVRLVYLGAGAESVLGVDAESALADASAVVDAVHPDDRERYRAAFRASGQSLEPIDLAHRVCLPDGSVRHVRLIGQPRTRDDGAIIWDGIAIDETRRLQAEAQLEESRSLLAIAGRAARVGGWTVASSSDRVLLSDEACALHGVEPGQAMSVEEGMGFYAPEERERIRARFDACATDGTPYDEEFRFHPRGREPLWVRVIGEAVRDEDGRIAQVRGAIQDITEQEEARREIERLADRLTTTLESITDAFFTVAPDWRVAYVNAEAERVLGRDRQDVLGRDLWRVFPELRDTAVEREYRRAMRESVAAEFQYRFEARSQWFEVRAYPSAGGLAIYWRDITERKRQEQEIEYLALYDPLTRLPNRRLLLDRLCGALISSRRERLWSALLFLDLDHFKTLNDTLGHDAGDHMLREAARRLAGAVRGGDTVARFGGDEFAIILPEIDAESDTAAHTAERVADTVHATLTRPYRLGEHERHTTASIGITLFGDIEGDTADDVMKRADLAMYEAKEAGRNTLRMFAPAMRTAVQSRVNLETDLREALDEDAIRPWVQPQVDARGRVFGAELLARWPHPERGTVSPTEFIPVAEDTGLIVPLGRVMLERACAQLAEWANSPATSGLELSVNVSAREFHHPDFVEHVRAIRERTGAPPERLLLELTETVLLADIEDTSQKMTALRREGIRFALDDFGTGYSSLAYLKRLPLDQLKIDQGFVRDALSDANDAAIVRTIIVLADTLGLDVIAEGVESEATRDLLVGYGCTRFQGFLFARPIPIEQFDATVDDCA